MEITGSLIKRPEGETAPPVTTLKASELEKSRRHHCRAGGASSSRRTRARSHRQVRSARATAAAAFADLRGLGAESHAGTAGWPAGREQPVRGASGRPEHDPDGCHRSHRGSRDGASAIYGTDAIAGVVNIITRKEYQGISVAADGKWPSSNGNSYGANIVGGYGSLATDGWNVYGGFSYQRQNELKATDRDYSSTGVIPSKGMAKSSGTTFPATWFQFDPNTGDRMPLPILRRPPAVLRPTPSRTPAAHADSTMRVRSTWSPSRKCGRSWLAAPSRLGRTTRWRSSTSAPRISCHECRTDPGGRIDDDQCEPVLPGRPERHSDRCRAGADGSDYRQLADDDGRKAGRRLGEYDRSAPC